MLEDQSSPTQVTRWRDVQALPAADTVAREEPLEMQINGHSLAVLMRTPGHDEALALGFLLTERIVPSVDAVLRIRHCSTVPDPDAEDNVIQIQLREGFVVDFARLQRNLFASSSCGVCGKATIQNAMDAAPPLTSSLHVSLETLYALPARLREAQETFASTGGLHAAGLFTTGGECLVVREDVGRHNAVDKVIGWAAAQGLEFPLQLLLMVSGRVSFEVVQKALAAGIPLVAAVSAPTSLAISLAEAAGMTLVGFLRERTLNVYSHPDRILETAAPTPARPL